MATSTDDAGWSSSESVKTLILEHSLAAGRHGFASFFQAFKGDKDLRSRVFSREQSGSEIIKFIGTQFLPLVRAVADHDNATTEKILREYSPLLQNEVEARDAKARADLVADVRRAVDDLDSATTDVNQPILSLLIVVHRTKLLTLPDLLSFIVER